MEVTTRKNVTRQSLMRLDRGGLPSETSESGSLEEGQPAGTAEGTILGVSTPYFITQMCRFKFSPERPPRS